MSHLNAWRLWACGVVAGAAIVCRFTLPAPAEAPATNRSDRPLYHAKPEHLWNRLHETLFVRVGPDGRSYGRDRLEPLLWRGSKHLLDGESHERAVAVLEEFLKHNHENPVEDPVKRAVLQRDLWLVFDWLEGDHGHFYAPELKPAQVVAARDRLRRPLAASIGRLALTPDQIKKLPDNYAAAVASGAFPGKFEPDRPDQPYLPADLLVADGPWVSVGRQDGPVAPEHLDDRGTHLFTNSVFLVFLKLPAGRAATIDYLQRLRAFDGPMRVEAIAGGNPTDKYIPNPKLPQFPAGTEAALVRRALVVASMHAPFATPITESVQVRVYREVPEMTVRNVRRSMTASAKDGGAGQVFQEFRLSREKLFAGQAGGLLAAVDGDERDFHPPFFAWILDEFENEDYRSPHPPERPFFESNTRIIKSDCVQCHSLPGVASFNSHFNFRANLQDAAARPFSLSEMSVPEVAAMAVKWKEARAKWSALRRLLAE